MLPVAYPSGSRFSLSERRIRYHSCVTSLLERQTPLVGIIHSFPRNEISSGNCNSLGTTVSILRNKGRARVSPLTAFHSRQNRRPRENQRTEQAKGTKGSGILLFQEKSSGGDIQLKGWFWRKTLCPSPKGESFCWGSQGPGRMQ